jgi:hypothetical protein
MSAPDYAQYNPEDSSCAYGGVHRCENSNDRAPVYKFQSIVGPFPAITSSAERKSSLLLRRFQTISKFSPSMDPKGTFGATRVALGTCPIRTVGRTSI